MKTAIYSEMNEVEADHWWYKTRRKIVNDLINKHTKGRETLSILDIGCGTGLLIKELETRGPVTGIDFSETALALCRAKGLTNVKLGSLTEIPEPSSKFDLVLALDVLEHVENDRRALGEIWRVLKPGGLAIIFVPALMFLWGIEDVSSLHYRRYTKPELVNKAKETGFTVIRSTYFNTFLFLPIALVRLASRLLPTKRQSDMSLAGRGVINQILYQLFLAESYLLKYLNLPVGVSAMVVLKKPI